MYSKIAFLTLLCLSGTALAQDTETKEVQPNPNPDVITIDELPMPPPPRPGDLLERFRRTEALIERNGDFLRGDQVGRIRGLLHEIDEIARDANPYPNPGPNPYPGPGPGPNPNPYPNPYPPRPGMIVSGTIGQEPFNFTVRDAFEFFQQCSGVRVTQTDRASVSVNFGASRSLTTGGWWYSAEAACIILTQTAVSMGLPQQRFPENVIVATVSGRQKLVVAGNSLPELNASCNQQNAGLPSQFDAIDISINWGPVVRKTTGGWWRTQAEACQVILTELQARGGAR